MEQSVETVWSRVIDIVSDHINAPSLRLWFEGTRPLGLYEGTLEIEVPNELAKNYIEGKFKDLIEDALKTVTGYENTDLVVVIESQEVPRQPSAREQFIEDGRELDGRGARTRRNSKEPRNSEDDREREERERNMERVGFDEGAESVLQAKRPRPFKAKYTFDTFVIGAGNRFAHAAALAVAETPGVVYNPLFIYGGVGLGKTHLLHAVGQYIEDQDANMQIKYVTAEQFTNEFINSIRDDKPLGFQRRYRENDVLLIDDIQFLEKKEQTQEEFFHTFNALYEENKQIVIASDSHPKYIQTLQDRLVSRFEWGLVTDIQPPDLETRIAILRKKAMMDKLEVDDEVMTFIASKVSTNIRELEGTLVRILAYAALYGREVSVHLAEEVLKDILPDSDYREIPVELIQHEICRYFGLNKSDLIGSGRSRAVVYPRQIAMYLCRELTDESLPKIGKAFGGRDHTTVIHATSKISKLINSDRDVFNQIHEVTYQIKSKR